MQVDIIKNAKRNTLFGFINKAVLMLCPFLERTAIRFVLGAEYLGLNSLFVSVLTVLNLTEMGFGAAMVYHMYKPLAEGDTKKINALLSVYKSVYRVIGIMLLGIGLMLIPVLPSLIKDSYPQEINLTRLYLIYLSNTVLSYFSFAYLSSLLIVHQRTDVQSTINSLVRVLLLILQVAALLLMKSYYAFAVLLPVSTVINNCWVAYRVRRLYPQYRPEGMISQEEKRSLKTLVIGSFIQRACAVTRNSLDSICISAFFGLTLTAIYDNYYAIMASITAIMCVISAAFEGGIGNHVVTKTVEENFLELKRLNFFYLWIGGWSSACLLCLYQPFIQLWMGKNMVLQNSSVILLVVYYYLLKLGDMITLYFTAKGLWWKSRHRSIAETCLNVILNILLGKTMGINGIILATLISLFLCNYIWSTRIIFQCHCSSRYFNIIYRANSKIIIIYVISNNKFFIYNRRN